MKHTRKTLSLLTLAPLLLLSGCASVTTSPMQKLSIETIDKKNEVVRGARCKVSNDRGSWHLTTPGQVIVRKSAANLMISCKIEDYDAGTTNAVSKAGLAMWGNLIIGGVLGGVVDHCRGVGYCYPSNIVVTMGETNTISRSNYIQPKK